MFKSVMRDKGFAENTNVETPNDVGLTKKPLNPYYNRPKRVDINILKTKLQEHQNKEFKKNMIVFLSFLIGLGSLGIYLSI